jgi:putrescine transport system substrate-binding protein
MKKPVWGLTLAALCAALSFSANAQESLHIYNWSDYIAEDTIANFEKQTGIKVTYDVYDSNEVLEAKLFAGSSGYDLVFPTARPFADRHIRAGLYRPLDKQQLSRSGNLDPVIMQSLTDIDPDNQYLVPYMWGTTGIGFNVAKVRAILGDQMPRDTWRLLFDPEIVAKLAVCGVSLMDDPTEVFVAARAYLGEDTDDFSKAAMDRAAAVVKAVRGHLRYFHNSQYINDLANGDLCVAHGYSGDILQARDRAAESGNKVQVGYAVPSEGAVIWTDVMAIPKDAPNPGPAHRFIDYLLDPQVIAPISNYVAYANANAKALDLVDEEIRNDPGVYPREETRKRLLVMKTPSEAQTRYITRTWTRVKTGH